LVKKAMSNTRGIWIAFEGPDGAGKTTSLNATYERLTKQGYKVVKTREPGGTPVSEEIRDIILTQYCVPRCEMLLFAAARAQHVEQMIKPALEAGYIVLCDRFSMSSYAYQQVARGLGPDVTMLDTFARNGAWPDFVAYFDVDVEEGVKRLETRAAENGKSDRIDQEGIAFKKRVNEGFKKAYDEKLFKNVYRVDANMAPIYVDIQINTWLEWDVLPCHTGENMPKFGYPDRPDLSRFVQEWIDKSATAA
jgi:dTMP kinase